MIEVTFSARRSGCCFTIFKPQFVCMYGRDGSKGGQGAAPVKVLPPSGPAKKVLDKAATCQNFLHYILTNEFACVYVFII